MPLFFGQYYMTVSSRQPRLQGIWNKNSHTDQSELSCTAVVQTYTLCMQFYLLYLFMDSLQSFHVWITVIWYLWSAAETSSRVWGGWGRRISAEEIFLLSPQVMKFGGDSLSLGTKCLLSVHVYGNIGIYLNLLCPIHTADATQLSSWVVSALCIGL